MKRQAGDIAGPLAVEGVADGTPLPVSISGSIAIGTVDQGDAGSEPWLVRSGVPLDPASPATASVGITSAEVVAANASRRGLVLINVSANRISFGLGMAAVLDAGITLMPNGGVWEMDAETFTTDAITAIASAASSTLAVQEFT